MNIYRTRLLFALCLTTICALLPPAAPHGEEPQPQPTTKGYNCVFMGHSFFYPIAETFDKLALANGFPDHRQLLRKAGATNGTPGWLWQNLPKDDAAWTKLANEDVDLLCFPHHHISGCRLEDYCNWIDYARQRNPNIMIAIAIPWGPLCDVPPAQFSEFYRTQFELPVRTLVDELRKRYPDNTIFVIPHGKGVADLYAKFKAGEIPELTNVLPPAGDAAADSFFADRGAHIGRMPLVLSQLIWLATVYQVDVRKIEWDTGYQFDLKAMAYDIVSKDPYAKIGGKKTMEEDGEGAENKPGTEGDIVNLNP